MTYKELLEILQTLDAEQLGWPITVELGLSDECIEGELRICDIEHGVLDDNHPVIYIEW